MERGENCTNFGTLLPMVWPLDCFIPFYSVLRVVGRLFQWLKARGTVLVRAKWPGHTPGGPAGPYWRYGRRFSPLNQIRPLLRYRHPECVPAQAVSAKNFHGISQRYEGILKTLNYYFMQYEFEPVIIKYLMYPSPSV